MKTVTNTEIIETRAKWAKRIAPLTMLFLIGGLITNFMSINQPAYFRPTMILLAFGFVFAIVSSHLTNRWVREPRSDQILTNMLKKFSNDFILFNYTISPAHILLTPGCLYVIVVKQHDGNITVNGHRFSRGFSWKLIFRYFADEGVGAPVSEAESGVNKLAKQLGKELAPEEIPEIKPLILFSNKDVQLTIKNPPPVPLLQSHEFKTYLREQTKNKNISASQRKTLARIIGGQWAELQKIGG
jgi:hypothetical protein